MTPYEEAQIKVLNTALGWIEKAMITPKAKKMGPNIFCKTCGTQHVYSQLLSDEERLVHVCPKCFPEDV